MMRMPINGPQLHSQWTFKRLSRKGIKPINSSCVSFSSTNIIFPDSNCLLFLLNPQNQMTCLTHLLNEKILWHLIAPLFIWHNVYRPTNASRIARVWVQPAIGRFQIDCSFDWKWFLLIDIFRYAICRWFFDGCCECVGSTCINYGIKESRCLQCPEKKDNDLLEEEPQEDDLDYGENHI